jgi:predicted O-methyltransferase YrrM
MKSQLLDTATGKKLYKLKEKLVWQKRLGRGVANVDVSRFGASENSDIQDHLHTLALLLNLFHPKVILELGTRGGESTRVFHEYCQRNSILGRSVDLSAPPSWLSESTNWVHFQGDDIEIGRRLRIQKAWPNGDALKPIDFLFIDTSHEYFHTLEELRSYIPLVRPGGLVVFHDTNLSAVPHRRLDGSIGYGWDNNRGVARAIEEYFRITLRDEVFYSAINLELISDLFHFPWNNGLTVLKLKSKANNDQ